MRLRSRLEADFDELWAVGERVENTGRLMEVARHQKVIDHANFEFDSRRLHQPSRS